MCGKASYPTYTAARSAARRTVNYLKRTTGRSIHNLEPYYCNDCRSVHLTSHSNTKLKKVG